MKINGLPPPKSEIRNSIYPFRIKHIRIPRPTIVPITGKNQVLAIAAEHREAVEDIVESDLFQASAIHIDFKNIELAATLCVVIRSKND